MLPRNKRIQKKDFPAPKRQGFRVHSPLFSMTVYKNDESTRVSVVVSKKTAKTAVVRNKIRRRMYEAMKPFMDRITKTSLIVIYPKKEVSTIRFNVLKKEIETTLSKGKFI